MEKGKSDNLKDKNGQSSKTEKNGLKGKRKPGELYLVHELSPREIEEERQGEEIDIENHADYIEDQNQEEVIHALEFDDIENCPGSEDKKPRAQKILSIVQKQNPFQGEEEEVKKPEPSSSH